MDEREQRIREKAFQLWLEEGQPQGQHERHWELASELVAIEESQKDTTIPLDEVPAGEPVEPIEALENAGEFPTMTDQGEMEIPHFPEESTPSLSAGEIAAEEGAAETAAPKRRTTRRAAEAAKQPGGENTPAGVSESKASGRKPAPRRSARPKSG